MKSLLIKEGECMTITTSDYIYNSGVECEEYWLNVILRKAFFDYFNSRVKDYTTKQVDCITTYAYGCIIGKTNIMSKGLNFVLQFLDTLKSKELCGDYPLLVRKLPELSIEDMGKSVLLRIRTRVGDYSKAFDGNHTNISLGQ